MLRTFSSKQLQEGHSDKETKSRARCTPLQALQCHQAVLLAPMSHPVPNPTQLTAHKLRASSAPSSPVYSVRRGQPTTSSARSNSPCRGGTRRSRVPMFRTMIPFSSSTWACVSATWSVPLLSEWYFCNKQIVNDSKHRTHSTSNKKGRQQTSACNFQSAQKVTASSEGLISLQQGKLGHCSYSHTPFCCLCNTLELVTIFYNSL